MMKILVTPYMMDLINNHTPFIVFYDNGQILEGDEVSEYEAGKPLLNAEKGYWDIRRNCYCLIEPGAYEIAIYFDLLPETGVKGYLENIGFKIFDSNKGFGKVYNRKKYPFRPYTVQYMVGPCYNFFGFKTEKEAEEFIKRDSRDAREYLETEYPCVRFEEYVSEYGYKFTKVIAGETVKTWVRIYK